MKQILSKCRSCGAPIFFVATANSRQMPVDAEPVADGNVDISSGVARVVKEEERPGKKLYKSHFVTCNNPARFQKKGKKA